MALLLGQNVNQIPFLLLIKIVGFFSFLTEAPVYMCVYIAHFLMRLSGKRLKVFTNPSTILLI